MVFCCCLSSYVVIRGFNLLLVSFLLFVHFLLLIAAYNASVAGRIAFTSLPSFTFYRPQFKMLSYFC